MLLGWGAPFTAVQLLFVNVVADGLPGFALETSGKGMDEAPIPKTKGFLHEAYGKRLGLMQQCSQSLLCLVLPRCLCTRCFSLCFKQL